MESQTQPAEIGGRFGQAIDRYGFDAIWWWYYAGTSLVLLLLFACPFVRHSPPVPFPLCFCFGSMSSRLLFVKHGGAIPASSSSAAGQGGGQGADAPPPPDDDPNSSCGPCAGPLATLRAFREFVWPPGKTRKRRLR